MRRVILAVFLVVPSLAWGQPAQQQAAPQVQAMTQTIMKLTGEAIDWQTKAITIQQQADADKATIAELQKQLEAAKVAKGEPAKP